MKCPNCGNDVNEEYNYCNYCGFLLRESTDKSNGYYDSTFELVNENGDLIFCELLDLIKLRGEEYAVFLPTDEDAEDVFILKVEILPDGNCSYVSVDNDNVLNTVFMLFKERNQDKFMFTD